MENTNNTGAEAKPAGLAETDPTAKKGIIPDFVKAVGVVVGTFVMVTIVAIVIEFAIALLSKWWGTPDEQKFMLESLPRLAMGLSGIIAAIASIGSLRNYNLFSRVLGGAIVGFLFIVMRYAWQIQSGEFADSTMIWGIVFWAIAGALFGKKD